MLGPRLVMAGVASGVGKTTLSTGVMAAFASRGTRVAAAKVGPDFIDPGYHSLATGRPGRNLDSWICGEPSIAPLAGRAGAGAEVLVVEGVMGLFDGAASDGPDASTASVARLLEAPVVLVVDASSMSRSVAALVHGYASFDHEVSVGAVILNRVGSPGHEELLRRALDSLAIPVLGALPADDALTWRDRHLGLVPVAEQPAQVGAALDRLAVLVERHVDLDALAALARTAPARPVPDPVLPHPVGAARVAVAGGPAFTFVYRDNLEAMVAAGAELVAFDPLTDRHLPEGIDALYVGGGFPEVYAAELSANEPLLADVRGRVNRGLVTWAECGGLLWLSGALDGSPLVGVVPAQGSMTGRLTLGYRTATVLRDSPVAPAGTQLRGHEFHYSVVDPPGDALEWRGRQGTGRGGYASANLLASYVHLHLGGDPEPGRRFVHCASTAAAAKAARASSG